MSLEDVLIRRRVFSQRFAGSLAADAEKTLLGIVARAQARILQEPTAFQRARSANLVNDISLLTKGFFNEFGKKVMGDIIEFAEAELSFVSKATGAVTKVNLTTPAFAQIEQAVTRAGMSALIGPQKINMQDAFDTFSAKKSKAIQQVISDGILDGRTSPQIARAVGELSNRSRAQVKTLVRTATNHASSQAHKGFAEANKDILEGEEFVATLDDATTLICGGFDGQVFPVGAGPFPPLHFNCRSVRVPKVKDEFGFGDVGTKRPEIGADGAGQVTGQTKFDGWLRRQPADFQDDYFSKFPDGKEKARLFRGGKLGIQSFRDDDGRNFTLDELRKKEPIAFGKANL